MPLSRRELILTQLCCLRKNEPFVPLAERLIPEILQLSQIPPLEPGELNQLMVELVISQTEILLNLHLEQLKKTHGLSYEPICVRAQKIDQYIVVNIGLQQPKHELHLRDFFDRVVREYLFPVGVILYYNEQYHELFTPDNLDQEFHEHFKTDELLQEVVDFLNSQRESS